MRLEVGATDMEGDLGVAEVGIAAAKVQRGRVDTGIEVLYQVQGADAIVVVVIVVARLGEAHEAA